MNQTDFVTCSLGIITNRAWAKAWPPLYKDGLARSGILQTKFTPADGQYPKSTPYDPSVELSEQVAESFSTPCWVLGMTDTRLPRCNTANDIKVQSMSSCLI